MRDDSHIQAILMQNAGIETYAANCEAEAAEEKRRPFMLLRPRIMIDEGQWLCLYGDNLQDGVCGFGDTPDLASRDFDKNWKSQRPLAKKEMDKEKI